jgi:hypothetical protein
MERRQSSRLPANLPARLTPISERTDAPPVDVTVEEFSGNGARVWSTQPLALGSLVKLELDDDLFLGEVRHCSPSGLGFQTGLHLDCALASLSGIRALMRALLDPGPPAASGRDQTLDARQQRDQQQHRERHQENPA